MEDFILVYLILVYKITRDD